MFIGFLRFSYFYSDWTVFKNQLNSLFVANNIEDTNIQRSVLLSVLDLISCKVLTVLCYPETPERVPISTLMNLFDQHFFKKPSVFENRYNFYNATKTDEETIENWAERLKNLASSCQFGSELNLILRDKFVIGIGNMALLRLLNEKFTLEECIKEIQEKYEDLVNIHFFREYCEMVWIPNF